MSDRITVRGIRFHARHGATRVEREVGVRYSVTVDLERDLTGSMRTDALADTVDYAEVHRVVLEVARRHSFHLLETLAGQVAAALLALFPVDAVRIRLRKETPVLDGIVDSVGVDIRRSRGEAIPPPPASRS